MYPTVVQFETREQLVREHLAAAEAGREARARLRREPARREQLARLAPVRAMQAPPAIASAVERAGQERSRGPR
jgi:hypothetical protein